MSLDNKQFYEFGPYRLDPVKRILVKEGEPVPLTPKAFDTLLVLVQSAGDIVQKDDLMKRVWPDSFVEEGNLTVNISILRKALGESPNQHRYIVTVPGRGYRFVADVRELLDESAEIVIEEHSRSRLIIENRVEAHPVHQNVAGVFKWLSVAVLGNLRGRAKLAMLAASLSIAVAVALSYWLTRGLSLQKSSGLQTSLRLSQLAGFKSERNKDLGWSRFSPDGRMIAFSSPANESRISILQIGGGEPVEVTQDQWKNSSPIWSSDGQRLAFLSNRGNEIGIWSIPFLGGTPTLLKTLQSNTTAMNDVPRLTDWINNGATIYYEWNRNLFALDVVSKEISQVNIDPSLEAPREFRVSLDGNLVVFVARANGQPDLWVTTTRGGATTRVTNDSAVDRSPVWHPDGQRIVYSSYRGSFFNICAAHLDGRQSEQITFGDTDARISDLSADGTKILYDAVKDESDLWELKLDGPQDSQVTSDIGVEFWPEISTDCGTVVYHAVRGTGEGLKRLNSMLLAKDLSTNGRTVQVSADGFEPQWSSDGENLAFMRWADGRINLWVTRASGGEERQMTNGGISYGGFSLTPPKNRSYIKDYSWSPDGTKIIYCSRKDDLSNVWQVTKDGNSETRITNNTDSSLYFNCPLWSPDGSNIAWLASSGEQDDEKTTWSIWLTQMNTSRSIFKTDSILRLIGWFPSGNELLVGSVENETFRTVRPAQVKLLRISTLTDSSQAVGTLPNAYLANLRLSPDGKSVSFVGTQDGNDNIWLLPVNGGEAKKLTSNTDSRTYFSSVAWAPNGKTLIYGKQSSWGLLMLIENFT